MSYSVSPGNIFGRIGEGFGKGLGEQIPKEVERVRLRQGLEELSKQKGLSPFQQFTRLATLPGGGSPTLMQGAANLLQAQSIRDAYGNLEDRGSENFKDGSKSFNNSSGSPESNRRNNLPEKPSSQQQVFKEGENIGLSERSPLDESLKPKRPWDVGKRRSEVARIMRSIPNLTLNEAQALASESEQRERAQPEFEQALEDRLAGIENDFDNEFDKMLSTQTQKSGKDTYADVIGEDQQELRKEGYELLKNNPYLTKKTIAEKLAKSGLNSAKAKVKAKTLLAQGITDINPTEKYNQLKGLSKLIPIAGNREPYKDMLVESGLSPQQAAGIAYDLSDPMKDIVKSIQPEDKVRRLTGGHSPEKAKQKAVDIAKKVKENINDDDSILKIIREIKNKDPYFDESSFFTELRDDAEDKLNFRQSTEATTGVAPRFGSWEDFWLIGPGI